VRAWPRPERLGARRGVAGAWDIIAHRRTSNWWSEGRQPRPSSGFPSSPGAGAWDFWYTRAAIGRFIGLAAACSVAQRAEVAKHTLRGPTLRGGAPNTRDPLLPSITVPGASQQTPAGRMRAPPLAAGPSKEYTVTLFQVPVFAARFPNNKPIHNKQTEFWVQFPASSPPTFHLSHSPIVPVAPERAVRTFPWQSPLISRRLSSPLIFLSRPRLRSP